MKIRNLIIGCLVLITLIACNEGQDTLVKKNFAFAGQQLTYAVSCLEDVLKDEQSNNKKQNKVIPRSLKKDGSLKLVSPYDWCSGFFPGSLWQMYEYTGNQEWKDLAAKYTWSIEQAKNHRGTHDLGFMIFSSFGKGYQLTGSDDYKEVVLRAANTLSSRFNKTTGCIRSWDFNRDRWQYPVIIDNMMNLELLFWAAQATGNTIYYDMAVSHADATMKNHFRPDYTSYHVINYDTITGNVISKETLQGYSDQSVWSRGQAWALYGFTMCYRYTQKMEYLKCARNIADMLISYPGLPADLIPYWDMSDPAIPDSPRDASAACITASALYELSEVLPINGSGYRKHADKILFALDKSYKARVDTHKGFLLLHSTGNFPAGDEVDVPISYADYYYLEALIRKDKLDKKCN